MMRVEVASAGRYASHLHLAPDRQPCQQLAIQVFYVSDALPAAQPTVSKQRKSVFGIVKETLLENNCTVYTK